MIVVVSLSIDDAAGMAELRELRVLELEAHLLGDHLAAREDRDVLEHPLAAVAEAGRLDGDGLEGAAELVDDDRGERLALDVLRDDQQRLARLDDLLEHRQEVLDRADLRLAMRMNGSSSTASIRSGSVTMYGDR